VIDPDRIRLALVVFAASALVAYWTLWFVAGATA
jgi:hypothetical protein